jgi:hypothetical protein
VIYVYQAYITFGNNSQRRGGKTITNMREQKRKKLKGGINEPEELGN